MRRIWGWVGIPPWWRSSSLKRDTIRVAERIIMFGSVEQFIRSLRNDRASLYDKSSTIRIGTELERFDVHWSESPIGLVLLWIELKWKRTQTEHIRNNTSPIPRIITNNYQNGILSTPPTLKACAPLQITPLLVFRMDPEIVVNLWNAEDKNHPRKKNGERKPVFVREHRRSKKTPHAPQWLNSDSTWSTISFQSGEIR